MKHRGYVWSRKPPVLTDDETILHQGFLNDEHTARYAIWRYVEKDIPIPNELKPILLKILQTNYKGKSSADTAAHWTIIAMEIAFLIAEKDVNQEEAIEEIAAKYGEDFSTVERRYRDGKFSSLKKSIFSSK
jgi:hypothetical protein